MSYLLFFAIAALFVSPLVALISQLHPEAWSEVVTGPQFSKIIAVTLISAFVGSLLSAIWGLLIARVFALYDWRGKRFFRLAVLFPYLVPNFVLATAYVVAWNPVSGLLNTLVRFPFGLYGLGGMTFLLAVVHFPIAFLLLEDKMRRLDGTYREAAQLAGASLSQVFAKIELPLLRPTLAASLSLCFALNIAAFAIPAWIGAPEKIYPLSYKIYQAVQLGGVEGFPQAASYALILFFLAVPSVLLASLAGRNEKKYAVLSGKSSRQSPQRMSGTQMGVFQILFWAVQAVFWIAPLASLFLSTLVPPGCLQERGWSCLSEPSLYAYKYVLFELAETKLAFEGSFIYGGLSAIAISVLSLATLILFAQHPLQRRMSEWTFGILAATPGAIIALGLIVVGSGQWGINVYNTPWIVVLAFIIKHQNLSFQPLRTGMMNISPSLLEAARLSGASTAKVWQHIVLPILKPEALGSFFLVLIPILGELTMSVFLVSPSFRSIGTVLFDLHDYADQAAAAALSVILALVILFFNELSRLLSRGRLGY